MLDRLKPAKGATRNRKRVGRGEGSGWGKTCGKGQNGQNSRSGASRRAHFEGGQMPMHRRLPKRGFSNYHFRTDYEIVNVADLARFDKGATVDPAALVAAGLVRGGGRLVKVLGNGDVDRKLTVKAHKFSGAAAQKIQDAGGSTETILQHETKGKA